jgi:TonB family protein
VSLSTSRRVFNRTLAKPVFAGLVFISLGMADGDESKDSKTSKEAKPKAPVYDPGGEITPPKLVHYVEPAFSSSSSEAFVEGSVKISTIVTSDGLPTELHIVRGLNSEEDRTAVDAVTQWRFRPGQKAGQAVNVRVTVEVDFHLL